MAWAAWGWVPKANVVLTYFLTYLQACLLVQRGGRWRVGRVVSAEQYTCQASLPCQTPATAQYQTGTPSCVAATVNCGWVWPGLARQRLDVCTPTAQFIDEVQLAPRVQLLWIIKTFRLWKQVFKRVAQIKRHHFRFNSIEQRYL